MSAPFADVPDHLYYHNSLRAWLTAAITAAVLLLVLLLVRRVLVSRLRVLFSRTTTPLDDMVVDFLAQTRTYVLVLFSIVTAARGLSLPFLENDAGHSRLGSLTALLVLWQAALWASCVVSYWVRFHLKSRSAEANQTPTSVTTINAIGVAAKVFLWLVLLLVALEWVFDVNVAALITTLGVGGIAVALAVQNILGDVLAALAIVFDKPFDVGDSVGIDNVNGTVEHIGLKTTRIRSITGEQVVVGNGDMLKSKLRNYGRMSERRVSFNLDVTFDTAPEILERLPGIMEDIIKAQKPVRFDRCHVASFTDSAIRLETVYYVETADYKTYMNVQQAINLEVLRRFAAAKVKFAFPSQTVYHEGPMAKDLAVTPQPDRPATT
jgi:small-conductance mechanosensitive channel